MRSGFRLGVVAVALSLAAGEASAHHATTMFDYTKVVKLSGTVRAFQWTNPHSYMQIIVPNASGGRDEWSIEVGTPNVNARMGWRKDSIKPGDKIVITFSPVKDGHHGGTLRTATFLDGHILYGVANGVQTDSSGSPTIAGQGLPSLAPTPK
jgi:hypothetical protein